MTAEIRHGDCLALMREIPDASVDAVITDPPYCSGGFTEAARRGSNGSGLRSETRQSLGWFASDNMGTTGLTWLMRAVAIEAARLLRRQSSFLMFTDWRMVPSLVPVVESAGLRWQNTIVWDKGSAGIGRGFRATHEMILQFTNGVPRIFSMREGNVLRVARQPAASRLHQTQKPTELLRRLIAVVAPPGGEVLDPFAGSGSTGVACVETGRSFIGIEREAEYVAIARARIADADAQAPLALETA